MPTWLMSPERWKPSMPTDFSVEAFWNALRGALYIYKVDQESWRAIQINGMTSDFSWRNSALGYQQLYERAIARMSGEI
jgi:glycogen synthase